MMTDNYLNMKEILKLFIFNDIISDYLWSYGDHSILTPGTPLPRARSSKFNINIYLSIYLFIYLSIYLFIYSFIYLLSIYLIHNISPVSLCSVKACHLIKLPPVNLRPETGLKLENYYFFTFTFSRPEVRKLLLFYVFTFSRPEVRKLFRIYVFTFSRPEVRKLFRIYVFTFSRPEVGKLFHISMA